MLETALSLAATGMYIFPVRSQGKQPAIRHWQTKATTDPEQIKKWWSGHHKDRNIGIATEPSGLIVVDIDTKETDGRENYAKLLEKHGITDTLTVTTPTGGAHLYFHAPENEQLRSTVSKLAEGVDTRAAGGYVVAETSTTPKGSYERVIDIQIAPCPEWLVPLLKGVRKTEPRKSVDDIVLDSVLDTAQAREYLDKENPAVQGGGGDAHTYNVCCELHDMGISPEKAVEMLLEPFDEDGNSWNDLCEPPWSVDELNTKMSNAYDFAQSSPGCKSLDIGAIKSPPKHVHCVADMDLDIPPRDWIIEGRLIAGYVTVTVAPGGAGKSMYTMLEAISVATGQPLTGKKPTRRGAVLIYNTEDPQDEIERRIAGICIHYGIDPKSLDNVFYASGVESPLRFVIADRNGTIVTKDRKLLAEIILDKEIVLTTIDPFVRCHGVDENSNGDIDLVLQQLSRLATETNSAVSIVHHTPKFKQSGTSAGDMDLARGASALVSAARVVSTAFCPSIEEAEELGINPEERSYYLRIDRAKGNMTAPNTKPMWFRKESVELANKDSVGVLRLTEILGGERHETQTLSENTGKNILAIVAPYMGFGSIPTDEVVLDLSELVPEEFHGMGLAARKKKFIKLFHNGVGNDTWRMTANEHQTKIEGVMPWD